MPQSDKRERHYKIVRSVTFPHAFEDTLIRFEQLIEKDTRILEKIPERYRKHGCFSPAIARLIEGYVKREWPAHTAKLRQTLTATEGIETPTAIEEEVPAAS